MPMKITSASVLLEPLFDLTLTNATRQVGS
ncbi:hypothetical protein P3T21_004423 [Paraburkholderia sp. GAS334]